MTELILGALSAVWLGILTSISPCPLTSNLLAITFVSRRMDKPGKVLLAGLFYTLGRILTYVVIGFVLVYSLISTPAIAQILQKYMIKLMGPILIIAGMFLTDLLMYTPKGTGMSENLQKQVEESGLPGALFVGILFALSFCPISAAIFFGSLIPAAIQLKSGILLPALYGVGSGLPVIIFAVLVALGANRAARAFDSLSKVSYWAGRITGAVFIIAGIYMSLVHIFGVTFTKT